LKLKAKFETDASLFSCKRAKPSAERVLGFRVNLRFREGFRVYILGFRVEGQSALPHQGEERPEPAAHRVVAQVVVEAKNESSFSYFSFKRLVPGAFNVGFIGSTCSVLPLGGWPAPPRPNARPAPRRRSRHAPRCRPRRRWSTPLRPARQSRRHRRRETPPPPRPRRVPSPGVRPASQYTRPRRQP